jgi:ATP-dependent Clp protease ATP-binding subunit ClpA
MKSQEIAATWKKLIIGQDHVIDKITPYVVRAMAKLNSPGRPLGVFFLMGPTGTGKTRTAETLAEVLHGSEKTLLRVDCGEFQNDHEVAKLLGAPPGYLGHRETQPMITQAKLTGATSDASQISIVLFDEIEKAANSLWRALLGVLDKGQLRLGDNTVVNFENTIVFMSSNLGAKDISEMLSGGYGFSKISEHQQSTDINFKSIEKIGVAALKKKFPPEFPNRLDEIVTYYPLTDAHIREITRIELTKIRTHILLALGKKSFHLTFGDDTLDFLTKTGTSIQYGARELKRAITRHIMNPLADDIIAEKIEPCSFVNLKSDGTCITWEVETPFFTFDPDQETPLPEEPSPKKRTRTKSV